MVQLCSAVLGDTWARQNCRHRLPSTALHINPCSRFRGRNHWCREGKQAHLKAEVQPPDTTSSRLEFTAVMKHSYGNTKKLSAGEGQGERPRQHVASGSPGKGFRFTSPKGVPGRTPCIGLGTPAAGRGSC